MENRGVVRILVFGDSIAYGAWDTEGGWVERLKRDAHKRTVKPDNNFKRQVYNLGVGGHSSKEILSRLENEIISRKSKTWSLFLVFSYGTNDERSCDGIAQTSPEQFRRNNEQIIAIAKRHAEHILFVGTPPLVTPEVESWGRIYSDNKLREYESILREQVEEAGLPFLSVRELFESGGFGRDLNIKDDLHPNDAGHDIIFHAVRNKLEDMLSK